MYAMKIAVRLEAVYTRVQATCLCVSVYAGWLPRNHDDPLHLLDRQCQSARGDHRHFHIHFHPPAVMGNVNDIPFTHVSDS